MTATMTDLSRDLQRVFQAVRRGEVVTVTEHGAPLAVIQPAGAARRIPSEAEVAAAFSGIPVVRDVTWEQIRAETREE